MLEDINNVLNTGDVPNLYAPEDDETITTVLTRRMLKLLQCRESRLRASSCPPPPFSTRLVIVCVNAGLQAGLHA